jgi:predicted metal-dependent phosphoesterase TrpH
MPLYRVELHSHCQGDPIDSYLGHTLFQHIDRAKEVGLDAIAVTWHRKICAVPEAFAYARERGVLLIPGMEADVDRRHVVILNLSEDDLPGEPTWNQIRALRLRKPETLVLAPHPYYPHPCCLGKTMDEHVDCIDAVEWCILHVHWLPGRVNPNLRATSDAHSLNAIGKNASVVEADELTSEALFAGIRAGHVSFHRHSLELAPLVFQSARAMVSQPRHIGRWVKAKWGKRRVPALGSPVGARREVLP